MSSPVIESPSGPYTPESQRPSILILGTGGTIAGRASRAGDNVGYTAGQVSVADLVAAVPSLGGLPLQVEQIAQLDSKDMDPWVWRALALRIERAVQDADIQGVVVTHGTDTLEETAFFLQSVLAPTKPVVLTAAMRPASSARADGPANLADAVALALTPGACGVVAVLAGAVWRGDEVRKIHPYRTDAFGAGDAGPLGWVEEGRLRLLRPWPKGVALGTACLTDAPWPDVQIVVSHAGATGRWVAQMCASGVEGLVAACTGNGTLHDELERALLAAQASGIPVLRCTRNAAGSIVEGAASALPSAGALTPPQARVALQLQLLTRRAGPIK